MPMYHAEYDFWRSLLFMARKSFKKSPVGNALITQIWEERRTNAPWYGLDLRLIANHFYSFQFFIQHSTLRGCAPIRARREMAYSVYSPAVDILPPPPPQKTNSTALLLSASSGSFVLLGSMVQILKGRTTANASGARRKGQCSRIRLLSRERGQNVDCWTLHRVSHLLISACITRTPLAICYEAVENILFTSTTVVTES